MEANRVEVSTVKEVTAGTTPNAKFDIARITGERLRWVPDTFRPAELRSDRMSADPVKIMEMNSGTVNFEFSFPEDTSAYNTWLQSAFLSTWTEQPVFDNTIRSSGIASITASTKTIAVADQSGSGGYAGTAFKAYHLVRLSGFTNSANNGFYGVASSTATTIVLESPFTGADETPGSTASVRVKVVGVQGPSGDIVATSTGLTSTLLNFVNAGFVVGMWIKIGGTAAGRRFATEACNGWARIAAVSANAVTLDHRPTGWTTDAGTGKTIRIWTGDTIRNGTTAQSCSIQKRFLSQATVTRIIHRGMQPRTWSINIPVGGAVTGAFDFVGMSGAQSTSADFAPSYRVAPTWPVFTGANNVAALYENGVLTGSPNWFSSFAFTVNNNNRIINALGYDKPVKVSAGECAVTGTFSAYFGSNAIHDALMNFTRTSLYARLTNGSTAVVFGFPRVTFTDGSPNAEAKNTDVVPSISWAASYDSTTGAHITLDRFEYWEA